MTTNEGFTNGLRLAATNGHHRTIEVQQPSRLTTLDYVCIAVIAAAWIIAGVWAFYFVPVVVAV